MANKKKNSNKKKTVSKAKRRRILKRAVTAICIIAVIAGGFSVLRFIMPTESSRYIIGHGDEELFLTAHRGFSAVAPENTVAAFEEAGRAGYKAIEFDIHTTKDGRWVIMHNGSIDKMTDGTGNIADMTYDELMQYRIDAGNHIEDYPDLRIPTLDEALTVCKKYGMKATVEIKGGSIEATDEVLTKIRKYGVDANIIAFDIEYIKHIRSIDKDIELMYLVNDITDDTISTCSDIGSVGIAFNFGKVMNFTKLDDIEKAGLYYSAWTVDGVIEADLCCAFGVRYITTNRLLPE